MSDFVFVKDLLRHTEHRVDSLDLFSFLSKQAQASDAKESVERICDISRSVSKAASLFVLAGQHVGDQLVLVQSVESAQDREAGQDPPAVANVWQLLRSAIETTRAELSLRKPPG